MISQSINSVENAHLRYQLVPRTLAFVEYHKKIILIDKKQHKSFVQGQLNGIGGHFEAGEDPYQAVRREIIEETGLEIFDLILTAIIFIDTGINPGIIVFVFRAMAKDGKITISDEGDLVLSTRNEIRDNPQVMQDVSMLLDICDRYISGQKPEILRYQYTNKGELRIDIISG